MTLDKSHLEATRRLYDTTSAGEAITQLLRENRELSDVLNDICNAHQDAISVDLLMKASAILKVAAHSKID